MKIPISWLKDFIHLDDLSVEEIARKLTLGGMEADEIRYVGLPMPQHKEGEKREFKTNGIGWDRDKIVVAEIREVKPHPNADKLTLLDLYDGEKDQVVLTGAPNIFHLKGVGKLEKPLKVAYAKEGALLYDGHAEGQVLTTLKRAKIRGVDSYSMVCSEKELGITEESDGIILLDDAAPVGMPLADYMGDAVLDISILPNMGRAASMIGVARELSAMLGRELNVKNPPAATRPTTSSLQPVSDLVEIEIADPELNPRFVVGLIRNVEIKASAYQIQRRLKLAGMRPISNIVDATNYAMLEYGEPLHAFDYDLLKARAGDKKIKIITRPARDGEKIVTLDGHERTLSPINVLVCDEKGALSIAGVMGGLETEVNDATKNILLEGAAWNFISVRRTAKQHNLPSEAAFRISRGIHPALADEGVRRGLSYMAQWSGGEIAPSLVDAYPLPPKDARVNLSSQDVKRWLGIDLTLDQIADLLSRLEFKCEIINDRLQVVSPNHRLDIGEGVVGLADVLEEIARGYGYDNIPATSLADALPPQAGNPVYEWEERLRDLLVALGFQEVVSYRMTSAENESRIAQFDEYARLANPIAPEKSVLRRSLLASVLDALEKNNRYAESFSFFEIGSVFVPRKNELPDEPRKLALTMSGLREATSWDVKAPPQFDFFDMKGRLELLLSGLRLSNISYAATSAYPHLHPGKAAEIKIGEHTIGAFGELHPLAQERYELASSAAVLVAEFDLEILRAVVPTYGIRPIADVPPIYEDIALIVDESIPADKVEALIRQTGGKNLAGVRLFDLYRDEKIGAGKKSLAYALTYQADGKTMIDADAAAIRKKIVKRLEKELDAKLRS